MPNTEAKKTDSKHVSFLNYLPKNAVIWANDITFSKGFWMIILQRAEQHYKELESGETSHQKPEELFTSGSNFCEQLKLYHYRTRTFQLF